MPGRRSRYASLPRIPLRNSARHRSKMNVDRPSKNLITTLPVTASVTTTSARSATRSLPSTLPTKRRSDASSSSVVRWMRSVAFALLLADRQEGDSRCRGCPTTRSAKIAPIRAYWVRFSGDESGLAPMSRRTKGRPARTIWTARAGRSTPGSRPIRRIAAAIAAPVWPAVTIASALPFRTRSQPTRIEASFFSRRASAGCSCISMTWLAGTISTFGGQGRRRSRRSGRDRRRAARDPRGARWRGRARRARSPTGRGRRPSRRRRGERRRALRLPRLSVGPRGRGDAPQPSVRGSPSSLARPEGASSFGALISRTGRPP